MQHIYFCFCFRDELQFTLKHQVTDIKATTTLNDMLTKHFPLDYHFIYEKAEIDKEFVPLDTLLTTLTYPSWIYLHIGLTAEHVSQDHFRIMLDSGIF